MRKFSCDEARAHLSDSLAAEISRPDANVLEAHLLECDPCQSLAELFLWQDRVLLELAGQARIESLAAKVRVGLQNLDQVSVEDEAGSRWSWSVSPKWMAAAAAFILALVALIFWRPSTPESTTAHIAPEPLRTTVPPAPPEAPEPAVQNTPETPAPAPLPETPVPAPAPAIAEKPAAPAPAAAPRPADATVAGKTEPRPARPKDEVEAPPKNPGREVVAVPPKPKTLDEAVRSGLAFLKENAARLSKESKADELLLWTYLHGGISEGDPDYQALLKTALTRPLERTYNVAFTAMILEELDRVKYQPRIAQCAQFLLDNQCANGQWSYGEPSLFAEGLKIQPVPPKFKGVRKVTVARQREGPAAGDNSNSHIAMLGLRACFDAGIVLPTSQIDQAAKWWRESQTRVTGVKAPAVAPEGWCYGRHDHKPYGSMTVGGISSLVICDYIQGKDVKKDREVANGMEWLAKNFSVAYNPGPYEHARMEENSQHSYHYYMYGLERVGILMGTEQIGQHYWFAKGMQVLIDGQRPDGSWKSGGNEVHDTCFAILFLRKAARALVDVQTPGAGLKK